jgi:hypothetical protein
MNYATKQSSKAGSPVTEVATTITPTSPSNQAWPLQWDCFEADLFELQLDASPSLALRSRIANHLYKGVSYQRVMKASRFRLLHWMLQQDESLRQAELEGVCQ